MEKMKTLMKMIDRLSVVLITLCILSLAASARAISMQSPEGFPEVQHFELDGENVYAAATTALSDSHVFFRDPEASSVFYKVDKGGDLTVLAKIEGRIRGFVKEGDDFIITALLFTEEEYNPIEDPFQMLATELSFYRLSEGLLTKLPTLKEGNGDLAFKEFLKFEDVVFPVLATRMLEGDRHRELYRIIGSNLSSALFSCTSTLGDSDSFISEMISDSNTLYLICQNRPFHRVAIFRVDDPRGDISFTKVFDTGLSERKLGGLTDFSGFNFVNGKLIFKADKEILTKKTAKSRGVSRAGQNYDVKKSSLLSVDLNDGKLIKLIDEKIKFRGLMDQNLLLGPYKDQDGSVFVTKPKTRRLKKLYKKALRVNSPSGNILTLQETQVKVLLENKLPTELLKIDLEGETSLLLELDDFEEIFDIRGDDIYLFKLKGNRAFFPSSDIENRYRISKINRKTLHRTNLAFFKFSEREGLRQRKFKLSSDAKTLYFLNLIEDPLYTIHHEKFIGEIQKVNLSY